MEKRDVFRCPAGDRVDDRAALCRRVRLLSERNQLGLAVTEPHQNTEGDVCVRVARERDWYRWAWTGQTPKTLEVPVYLLWVE